MTELLFRDDAYARSCMARVVAADERGIRLDRTVFYPTGGGQPGDTGSLRLASGETIAIVDAVKGDGPDEVIHVPAPGTVLPPPATELTAEIDWERRPPYPQHRRDRASRDRQDREQGPAEPPHQHRLRRVTLMPYAHPEALVSTEWLAAHLGDPHLRVLDASYKQPGITPTAREDY